MMRVEERHRRLVGGVSDGGDDEAVRERYARAAWTAIVEPGDALGGLARAQLGAWESLELLMSGAGAPAWMTALADADVELREVSAAIERWRPRADPALHERALLQGQRWHQRLVVPGDELWPSQLDDLGSHAPAALWVRGMPERLAALGDSVALVGARASTGYGTHMTAELADAAARHGMAVVSGGAFGIDAAAHRVTLSAGGLTACVLAGGLDRWYPAANSDLIDRIEQRGVVVAEVPSGVAPSRWRFLQRNRVIAALATATVVVEASRRSGSINTAGHAAAIGRPLGAVPGPVTSGTSAGCHRVIRDYGAELVEGGDDVVRLVRGDGAEQLPLDGAVGPLEVRVLDALSRRSARTAEQVAAAAGMSVSEATQALGMLDLSGMIRPRGAGWLRAR